MSEKTGLYVRQKGNRDVAIDVLHREKRVSVKGALKEERKRNFEDHTCYKAPLGSATRNVRTSKAVNSGEESPLFFYTVSQYHVHTRTHLLS